MADTKQVNEYYLGKGRTVAVIDNQEARCSILNDSDIVRFITTKPLDFDDRSNAIVAAIKKDGYFLFQAHQSDGCLSLKIGS